MPNSSQGFLHRTIGSLHTHPRLLDIKSSGNIFTIKRLFENTTFRWYSLAMKYNGVYPVEVTQAFGEQIDNRRKLYLRPR